MVVPQAGFVMLHPAVMAAGATTPHPAVAAPQSRIATPIAVPVAVHNSPSVATINPAILHWQNPQLGGFVAGAQGAARTTFQLPTLISPTASPTDQTLFEEPQDATKKHYLPGYAVAATAGAAGPAKWVSLEPAASGYQLIVHLAESTPAALATGNTRQDATTRFLLTAVLQGRVASWDLALVGMDGGSLKLTLALPQFGDRDAVYQAMTTAAAQATLIIRRVLALALPMAATQPAPPSAHPLPVAGQPALRLNPMMLRQPVPGPASPPLYRLAAAQSIDTAIPFLFDKDLDGNVFARLGGMGGGAITGWNIIGINWNGRRYPYYQDRSAPDQIYFLPDAFKIARQPKSPRYPSLIVTTNGEDVSSVTLTLSYLATPVWDPRRVEDASNQLRQRLDLAALPALNQFKASVVKLSLQLPGADSGSAPSLAPQPDAIIDTTAGVQGAITLKLPQFQQLYAALFDTVSDLFSGQVEVTVDQDVAIIPFISRAGDFTGGIFDVSTEIDTTLNRFVATLQNAIESTIHVDGLYAALTRNNQVVPGCVQEVSATLPIDLLAADDTASPAAAAGSIVVAMQAPLVLPLDHSYSIGFDFSQAHVVPDAAAIWRAIMSNQVVGPVTRQIVFRLPATLVKPATGSPPASDAIMAIAVVFENGQTATFDASLAPDAAGFLNRTVGLSVPVEAYVLQEGGTDTYRYRVDIVTASGRKSGDWVTDNSDTVFVSVG